MSLPSVKGKEGKAFQAERTVVQSPIFEKECSTAGTVKECV